MYNDNNDFNHWKPLSYQEISKIHNRIINSGISGISTNNPHMKSLQPNLLKNPDFETISDTGGPAEWIKSQTGTTAVFTYPATGRTGNAISINYPAYETDKTAEWKQNVNGIIGSTVYTLSVYIKVDAVTVSTGVSGGARIFINWLDSNGLYINTSQYQTVTGTADWTQYTITTTAPPNANTAMIVLSLQKCSGTVSFDDVSFTGITAIITYDCIDGVCKQTIDGTYINDPGCGGKCPAPTATVCTKDEINVLETCIPRKYLIYGGIGFGALAILMLLKR